MMEQFDFNDNCSVTLMEQEYGGKKIVPILRSSGLFHCQRCNQGFKQRSNAQSHFKSVHLNVKKQCPKCRLYFKKIKSHIQDVHTVKKLIKCIVCNKMYQEGRLFKDHMNKTHHQNENGSQNDKHSEKTKCDVCGNYVFKTRFERQLRLRHYLPSNYVVECPICGAHVKYLPWHLQKFHKNVDYSKTMKSCEQCDRRFLSSEALESHLLDHEKYFCTDCFLHFNSHLKLAKHMYVVHKKVFNVGKRFKSGKSDKSCASAVTYHIEKHTGQEPVELGDTQAVHQELLLGLGNKPTVHENHEFIETLEEESFTVILDEKGNLQNVIMDNNEKSNRFNDETMQSFQLDIDEPTFTLEQYPHRERVGKREELKCVDIRKSIIDLNYPTKQKKFKNMRSKLMEIQTHYKY